MTRLLILLLPALCACQASGALPNAKSLAAVSEFDLSRYLGTWYEIAKYPVSFEKGLVGVTATYSMRDDGKVRVENAGFKGSFDGKRKSATAKAWAPDPSRPAELKVSFFWPFSAKYWVIALDSGYQWAVVGEPGRRYLWILSRSPTMSDALYERLVKTVRGLGYDTDRLERMPQKS
ncbi:MAG: lipocalin family protein [Planctomycetota bacterium]|jgi:apolipoprotein D and lipocalin family protein